MHITFLIGNGFDINLGLATKYSDFLNIYTMNNEKDSPMIKEFKKDIKRNQNLWGYAEKEFGNYTDNFYHNGYNADDFFECYGDFCNSLANYLNDQLKKINDKMFVDTLKQGFINAIQNNLRYINEEPRAEIMADLNYIPDGKYYNFINFNYTDTLDSYVKLIKSNSSLLESRFYKQTKYSSSIGEIIHVHGTTKRNMVLGVNDVSQIKNMKLFEGYDEEYLDQIIKIKTNEMNEEGTDRKANNILERSDFIYIYGMALGETDALWWKRVGTLLQKKPRLHVVIHCHDAPRGELLALDRKRFERQTKKRFLDFSGFNDEEKKKLNKRIHIDRFDIFDSLTNVVKDYQDSNETIITPKQLEEML